MQPRRGSRSRVAALAAVVLPMLVMGVVQTSTSDGRLVSPVNGTPGTRSSLSPTGRDTHAGRTHAQPPGKRVRPRGPKKEHRRRRHDARAQRLPAGKGERRSIAAAVRSSGDPGVTIADFTFTPGTITLHVGDTVQWVNNGPSPHTATANNGSFNSGVLQKGQSASVTFHLPGTFAYHCSIHPFMHGTVVVLASAKTPSSGTSRSSGNAGSSAGSRSSGSPSSSGGNTPGGTASTGKSGSTGASSAAGAPTPGGQGTLPLTGADALAVAALGLLLGGSGLLLHRVRRRRLS